MVVIVMGQYQQVWGSGLVDLFLKHLAVARRTAVDNDDAMLTFLVTLDDKGVTVVYR